MGENILTDVAPAPWYQTSGNRSKDGNNGAFDFDNETDSKNKINSQFLELKVIKICRFFLFNHKISFSVWLDFFLVF